MTLEEKVTPSSVVTIAPVVRLSKSIVVAECVAVLASYELAAKNAQKDLILMSLFLIKCNLFAVATNLVLEQV